MSATSNREGPVLATRAAVVPTSLDEEARTVEVTWSTGSDVVRRDLNGDQYVERLSMNPSHIRLERLNQGAPLLDTHSSYGLDSQLGVVESASIRDGKGVAKIRFSARAAVDPVWNDVKSGIIRNVSVGYMVHRWSLDQSGSIETRTATDWEPYELSLVPIPADFGAQVRALEDSLIEPATQNVDEDPTTSGEREQNMSEAVNKPEVSTQAPSAAEAVAAERKRMAEITSLCRTHGVESDAFIAEGTSVDAVRAAILETIGERQKATQISSVQVGSVDRDRDMRRDMESALLVRAGQKVEGDGYRNFGSARLLDLGRSILEANGVSTRTMTSNEVATRALSTSDFSSILNAVGVKLVRQGYGLMPMAHRTVFRQSENPDFKPGNRPVTASAAPMIEVPEGAEIPNDVAYAENSTVSLKTYAKIIKITRQLMINDDFGLVARAFESAGKTAASTERKVVWDLIKANGGSFFSVGHANTTSAGVGATVTAALMAGARKALRSAKAPDGTAIGAPLSYIVCGPSIETAFEQLLSANYLPTAATTAVTESLRSVTVLIEPEITDDSWYGFSPFDHVEYAYLTGHVGPRVEQKVGFEIEAVQLKVALDFGAGLIDYRGAYRVAQS